MKSYISYLYELDLRANESNPPSKETYQENKLLLELQNELTDKQYRRVEKLIDLIGDRYADECEFYFKKGFRFALRMAMECFEEQEKIKENIYE